MSDNAFKNSTLDLLVDGELDEQRRRELLLSLDASPQGWRQCALAFLEAQAWSEALPQLTVESTPSALSERRAIVNRSGIVLALAASLLIGVWIGARWTPTGGPAVETLVTHPPGDAAEIVEGQPAANGESPTADIPSERTLWPADVLELVFDSGDRAGQRLDVPLLPAPGTWQEAAWMWPSEGRDLLQQAEQGGYRIETRRMLAPLQLQDRRQLVFPVEELRFVPVSRETY